MSGHRVAITGSSGLIGSALSSYLRSRGDEVRHLVRHDPRTATEFRWDPVQRTLDAAALEGVDTVVHLAGAGIGDKRWTPAYKQLILSSRADGTATVARAVAAHGPAIRLVSASAVGYYGSDRGEEFLTEQSAAGEGFLADVVRAWEAATEVASAAGAPVATTRTGLVMARGGGAFPPLLRVARFGLAGPLGSGRQFWPWISLADTVRAFAHLIDRRDITGPVNVVGPEPVRQRDVAREIAKQLGRPSVLPAPAFVLHLVLGEFAREVVGGQRVLPRVLEDASFEFRHGTLPEAVATIV